MLGTPLKGLSDAASIIRCPLLRCKRVRKLYYDTLPLEHRIRVHNDCVCNELISLCNRHLVDRTLPEFDARYIRECFRKFRSSHVFPRVERVGYWDVIRRYHGGKKKVYMEAMDWLLENRLTRANARVHMFVKPDKYPEEDCWEKAPRAIQFRGAKFNLALARFLKPQEDFVYKDLHVGGIRQFSKGLTNVEKGKILMEKWQMFADPVAVLLDHAKFDSCVVPLLLRETHKIYRGMNKSKLLRWLLNQMVNNKGYTAGGIKYRVKGTRMSGDYDTAYGNSLLNFVVLFSLFGPDAQYLIDGDDSVVIMEKRWWVWCRQFLDHFRRFGFTTEYRVVVEAEQIEFCQLYLLSTGVLVRSPFRALARLGVSLCRYQGNAKVRYVAGKALGLAHQSPRDPLLYPVFMALAETSKKKIIDNETSVRIRDGKLEPPEPDDEVEYCNRFGISLEQLEDRRKQLLALIETHKIYEVDDTDYYCLPGTGEEVYVESINSGIA